MKCGAKAAKIRKALLLHEVAAVEARNPNLALVKVWRIAVPNTLKAETVNLKAIMHALVANKYLPTLYS